MGWRGGGMKKTRLLRKNGKSERSKTIKELDRKCALCPRVATDLHHIYRRSLRPDLKENPDNLISLCRICHRMATEARKFEEYIQDKFYPNPPKFRAKNDLW